MTLEHEAPSDPDVHERREDDVSSSADRERQARIDRLVERAMRVLDDPSLEPEDEEKSAPTLVLGRLTNRSISASPCDSADRAEV